MTLYETIFKRRSVRKFDREELSEDILNNVKIFLDGAAQLEGQTMRYEIVKGEAVKNGKASHYILAYCEPSAKAYINVGYVLQKADLYLQSIGIGSLWLGLASPKEKEVKNDFCIMLAFGKTDLPYRESESEFSRLSLEKISDVDNAVSRAARLAPSAVNAQPWKLFFEDGKVVVQHCGRGLLQAVLKRKLNKIDVGIVTRHIEVALLEQGKNVTSVVAIDGGSSFGTEIRYK